MPARASVQVLGIKEALKELNDFDKQYRRQVTKDIQGAGEQIISEARSMVAHFDNSKQNGAPLSGMVRGNLIKGRETSWRTDAVQKGFKVKVGVRASKERYVNYNRTTDGVITHTEQVVFGSKPYQLMVIQQANAAGAIYDHAGRNTQSMFVTNLNAEVGEQPRAIDKAVTNNREAVEAKVELVVNDVARRTNRKLGFNRGN
jgi:mRNA-degrading endonuclease RelE of RelBE toxin-antitoxin system